MAEQAAFQVVQQENLANPYRSDAHPDYGPEDSLSFCPDFLLDFLDWFVHRVCLPATCICGFFIRLAGPVFVVGFYYLMGYHTWVFLTIIATVMRVRVGTELAVVWTVIGIVITYNVVWNHLLAMCLRPGSPKDLIVSHHNPTSFA